MRLRNDVTVTYHKTRKRWLVRWHGKYDITTSKQPRFCKSYKRKRDADKFTQSLKNDIHDGISVEPKTITLKNLSNKVIEAKKGNISPETIDSYEETIDRLIIYFGSHRNIKTISPQEAQSFLNNLQYLNKEGTLSDYSRLKHMKNSQVVFNQAVSWNYIRNSPFKDISIKNLSKDDWHYINPKEFKILVKVVDKLSIRKKRIKEDTVRKIRLKAFYGIMYGCGLRFGEAINLRWDKNIDFINSKILIQNRISKDGLPPFRVKDHEVRSIECPKWEIDYLMELNMKSNIKNPYVFISDDRLKHIKKKWSDWKKQGKADKWKNSTMVNNTNRDFQLYCRKAGIVTSDRLSVQILRKGYGTNLANLSTPVHTLKELMGHSSITTTMKFYIKNSDENKKKAVRGLEGLMEG